MRPIPALLPAFLFALASLVRADAPGPGRGPVPRLSVFTPPLALPGLGRPRTLRIHLPPDYARSPDRRYPVLYVHDGQNLFDAATAYAGEWGVDEAMDALAADGVAAIVVGIDHGNARRSGELNPWRASVRLPPSEGRAYVADLVGRLKPFVDANYRTRPGRADTVVMGSSMGGLISHFALIEHPDVFGAAGVFSPSFWVSADPFEATRRAVLPPDARVYLYAGGAEGAQMVRDTRAMAVLLQARVRLQVRWAPGAGHDEAAWRAEFPRAARWLLAGPVR